MADFDPDILEAILKDYTIPIQPKIKEALNIEFQKESPNNKKIAELMETDVVSAGNLFNLLHSGPFQKKTDQNQDYFCAIEALIEEMGVDNAHAIIDNLIDDERNYHCDHWEFDRFWESAGEVALISHFISEELSLGNPHSAYLVGMFRDCGIPLMLQAIPHYKDVLKEAGNTHDIELIELENRYCFMNHQTVGYCLTRNWHLPSEVSFSILNHHQIDFLNGISSSLTNERNILVSITHIAELLSDKLHEEQRHINQQHFNWTHLHPRICQTLNLDDLATQELITKVVQRFSLPVTVG